MAAEDEICYICLEGNEKAEIRSCSSNCFAKAHGECLSRWQLHRAGNAEETSCRFCNQPLPGWRNTYASKTPARRINMIIVFNGKPTRIRVSPGPEGEAEFKRVVRALHGNVAVTEADLDVSFQFKAPDSSSGANMTLLGMSAFGAAVHCAALSKKEKKKSELHRIFHHSSSSSRRDAEPSVGTEAGEAMAVPAAEGSTAGQPRGPWGRFLQSHLSSISHTLSSLRLN